MVLAKRLTNRTMEQKKTEIIWEAMMDCMPKDAENLSTLLPDQKIRLLDKLIKNVCHAKPAEKANNPEILRHDSSNCNCPACREFIPEKINYPKEPAEKEQEWMTEWDNFSDAWKCRPEIKSWIRLLLNNQKSDMISRAEVREKIESMKLPYWTIDDDKKSGFQEALSDLLEWLK